jgi:hypothetical protein
MDVDSFSRSLTETEPPPGIPELLKALWWERKGDWTKAHEMAQDIDSTDAAWVHAYLHRREGDLSNAGYWYRQAGSPVNHGPLDSEWKELATVLLERAG